MITIFYEIGPEHRSQVRVLRDRSHRQIKIIKEVLRKKKKEEEEEESCELLSHLCF